MKHLKKMNETIDYTAHAKELFNKVIKPFWEKEYGETKFDDWYQGLFNGYTEFDITNDFAKHQLKEVTDAWKNSDLYDERIEYLFDIEEDNDSAIDRIYSENEDRIITYNNHVFIIPEEIDYRDKEELESLIRKFGKKFK